MNNSSQRENSISPRLSIIVTINLITLPLKLLGKWYLILLLFSFLGGKRLYNYLPVRFFFCGVFTNFLYPMSTGYRVFLIELLGIFV